MPRRAGNTRSKAKQRSSRPGILLRGVTGLGGLLAAAVRGVSRLLFGNLERFYRFISVAAVLGLLIGWFFARGPLMEYVARHRADPVRVAFSWPGAAGEPTWLPRAEREMLMQRARAVLTVDPFDQDALAAANAALMQTGWFEHIAAVRREPEGVVVIEPGPDGWRVPAALVLKDGRKYLVGFDGAPMRRPVGSTYGEAGYYIWEPAAAPPAYGEPWPSDDVRYAIEWLVKIDQRPAARQVRGIDLSEGMVLIADTGPLPGRDSMTGTRFSRIKLGSPVGREQPVTEMSAVEKLDYLDHFLHEYGRIDAGSRMLDLTQDKPTVSRTAGKGQ